MSQAAPKSRSHPSPGAVGAPPLSSGALPGPPADMRCRAPPAAPELPGPPAGLRRSRRGAAQNYLQHLFFKHMLVYENNHPGTVQAYTDKSTLRHEGLPKEWGKASTHPLSGSSTATERGTATRGPSERAPGLAGTLAAGAESGLGGTWPLSSYTSRLSEIKTKGFFQIGRQI